MLPLEATEVIRLDWLILIILNRYQYGLHQSMKDSSFISISTTRDRIPTLYESFDSIRSVEEALYSLL